MQNTRSNVKEVYVFIWWGNVDYRVTIEPHYGCDSFFRATMDRSISSIFPLSIVSIPLADRAHYLSVLKPLMAIRIGSWFFSSLAGGISHSLHIHKAQPRGWKKRTNEQIRTWVCSKCKRGKSVTLFVHTVS